MGKIISVDNQQGMIKSPKPYKNIKKKSSSPSSSSSSPLKITYISSPVTVKVTTASEFRAIVQELTGKDSDVADDVGPQEISVGEVLLRRPVPGGDNYGSEMGSGSVGVDDEEGRFFGYEDMEVSFSKDFYDGFLGLISPPLLPANFPSSSPPFKPPRSLHSSTFRRCKTLIRAAVDGFFSKGASFAVFERIPFLGCLSLSSDFEGELCRF